MYTEDQADVAALPAGGFVAVWRSDGGDAGEISARLFDAQVLGLGGDIPVNEQQAGAQEHPAVAALGSGGFVVARQGFGAASWGIHVRLFLSDGTANGGEFTVSEGEVAQEQYPSVGGLADGGFVILWESFVQDGNGWGIFGQRYAADGTKL